MHYHSLQQVNDYQINLIFLKKKSKDDSKEESNHLHILK